MARDRGCGGGKHPKTMVEAFQDLGDAWRRFCDAYREAVFTQVQRALDAAEAGARRLPRWLTGWRR